MVSEVEWVMLEDQYLQYIATAQEPNESRAAYPLLDCGQRTGIIPRYLYLFYYRMSFPHTSATSLLGERKNRAVVDLSSDWDTRLLVGDGSLGLRPSSHAAIRCCTTPKAAKPGERLTKTRSRVY